MEGVFVAAVVLEIPSVLMAHLTYLVLLIDPLSDTKGVFLVIILPLLTVAAVMQFFRARRLKFYNEYLRVDERRRAKVDIPYSETELGPLNTIPSGVCTFTIPARGNSLGMDNAKIWAIDHLLQRAGYFFRTPLHSSATFRVSEMKMNVDIDQKCAEW